MKWISTVETWALVRWTQLWTQLQMMINLPHSWFSEKITPTTHHLIIFSFGARKRKELIKEGHLCSGKILPHQERLSSVGGEGRRQRFLSFPCWGPEWIKGFLFQGTLSKIFGTHFNPILKLPPSLSKSIFNKLVTNLPSGCLKKNLIAQQQSQLLGNCSGTLNLYWQMFEINWSCSNSERKERLIFSEPGFLTFF